jgi:type II secretory pathway pseudopilin PulG
LVSLGVLGLIAGLTIPNVVASVEKGKNRAILRETIQVLSSITQAGVMNGDFSNITNWDITTSGADSIVDYMSSKLSFTKQCLKTDTASAGCVRGYPNVPPTDITNTHNARWILPSGAKVQVQAPMRSNSTYILWTITSKAYADNMVNGGENPDMVHLVCNLTEQPIQSPGELVLPLIIKPGMCGKWDVAYWGVELDKVMGQE